MKMRYKKITALSVLTAILLSQNTAFAQTVYVAEAPLATQPTAVQNVPKSQTPRSTTQSFQTLQSSELNDIAAHLIDVNTHFVTSVPKPRWSSQPADKTRWLLKLDPSKAEATKAPRDYSRDYSKEFTGLRTSVLANKNTKIGTATQYIQAGDIPFMKANTSSQSLYSKTDDNFLLRAKLDF